ACSVAAARCSGTAFLVASLVAFGCGSQQSAEPAAKPTGPVRHIAFSPDGGTAVASSYWAEVVEAPNQRSHGTFCHRVVGVVSTWDVSTDRAVLCARGGEREFRAWRGSSLEIPSGVGVWVSPDGRRLACQGAGHIQGRSRSVYLTDTVTGGDLPGFTPGGGQRAACFAFHPDGQLVRWGDHFAV